MKYVLRVVADALFSEGLGARQKYETVALSELRKSFDDSVSPYKTSVLSRINRP